MTFTSVMAYLNRYKAMLLCEILADFTACSCCLSKRSCADR